ncbi:MAG: glycosyltransferase family 2 protein [Pseudomonadota bacterium]|nr:glycosyltransferase family 2 protein [Pseudomonadota bacterium]
MTSETLPETSVIMVSYHTGAVLLKAVDAVLAQASLDKLYLVDNGNPPPMLAALKDLARANSRLCIITGHGNVGFGTGCNLGARVSTGRHLLFLNPDSLLPPDALLNLQACGIRLERPYMLGARIVNEDGTDQRGSRRALLTPLTSFVEALHLGRIFPSARLNFNQEPIPETVTPVPAISGSFMFLPREDFWKIGGFDEEFFLHVEDLDICLRFRRAGGGIYFVPHVVVTHIGGTSDATTAFVENHKARGFVRYFRKNFRGQYPGVLFWLLEAAISARTWLKIHGAPPRH